MSILDDVLMRDLGEIKKMKEQNALEYGGIEMGEMSILGDCDCSVGDCDCDGSCWR